MACPERERLAAAVREILRHIAVITQDQFVAFNCNKPSFYLLDRDLELAVGEKERRVGALRQHEKDHGCQIAPALGSGYAGEGKG